MCEEPDHAEMKKRGSGLGNGKASLVGAHA